MILLQHVLLISCLGILHVYSATVAVVGNEKIQDRRQLFSYENTTIHQADNATKRQANNYAIRRQTSKEPCP